MGALFSRATPSQDLFKLIKTIRRTDWPVMLAVNFAVSTDALIFSQPLFYERMSAIICKALT